MITEGYIGDTLNEFQLHCDTNNLSDVVVISLDHNNQRRSSSPLSGFGSGFSSNKMAVGRSVGRCLFLPLLSFLSLCCLLY